MAKERKKGLGSRLFRQSLDSESVSSFGQMAVCVAASKAAVQIKCLSTLRARDRDRPSVVAQDRISARETANAFTFCRISPPGVHLRRLLLHYTTPCASSAISQYLFYTPNVLQNERLPPSHHLCGAYLIKQVTESTKPIILLRFRSNASRR